MMQIDQMHPVRAGSVPVIWAADPFGGQPSAFVPPGLSIAEIVAITPSLPDGFVEHGICVIEGTEIDRAWWPYVRPRCSRERPVVVQFGIRLQGGNGSGGGKSTLRTAAMVALLVAAVAIGQFEVLGALGTIALPIGSITGAQLLAAGLATAALAIGAVSPPPSLPALAGATGAAPEQGAASLSGNVLAPGAPAPKVVGAGMRIFPPLLAPVLVERIGLDQYAEAIYGFAGPHAISAVRLGDTAADQIDNAQIEIYDARPGSPPPSLLTRYGYTQAVNADLVRHRVAADNAQLLFDQTTPANSLPAWSPFAVRAACDEAWVSLQLEGPSDWNAPGAAQATPFRIRFRRRGDADWVNGPEFHYASNNGAAAEVTLKIFFLPHPVVQPQAPASAGFIYAYSVVPGQSVFPTGAPYSPSGYFAGAGSTSLYSSATNATHNVRNIALYEDRIELYIDPAAFGTGVFEFQIMQGLSYPVSGFAPASYTFGGAVYDLFGYYLSGASLSLVRTRANLRDKATLTRIATVINSPPVIGDRFSLISVRVKNQSLGQLSAFAAAYIPTYAGGEWAGLAVSSNPAEHFRAIGSDILARKQAGADLIDDTDMSDWRQHCIDRGYVCNGVLQDTNCLAALDLIASAGFARRREAEKLGVVVDYRRVAEGPIMTFTDRNMRDLSWSNPLPQLSDGFLVRFVNEANDYRQDSVVVLRPGARDNGVYEETSNDINTDVNDVVRRATFDGRQLTSRMLHYSWSTNRKHIRARKGSLVAVNHSVLLRQTGSARVQAVIASGGVLHGLVLDATVATDAGDQFEMADATAFAADWAAMFSPARYGLVLERLDGSVSVHEIVPDPDGENRVALFKMPISDPGRAVVDADCAVATGPLGLEYLRVIVSAIEIAEDFTATITAVPEAPELFNSDGSIALN
jgi:hypothetical protein